jgi:hypothetical protein
MSKSYLLGCLYEKQQYLQHLAFTLDIKKIRSDRLKAIYRRLDVNKKQIEKLEKS